MKSTNVLHEGTAKKPHFRAVTFALYLAGIVCIVAALLLPIPPAVADAFLQMMYPIAQHGMVLVTNTVPFPIFENFQLLSILFILPLIGYALIIPRSRLLQRGQVPVVFLVVIFAWMYISAYMIFVSRAVYARTPFSDIKSTQTVSYHRSDLTALEHLAAKRTTMLAPFAHFAHQFQDDRQIDASLNDDEFRTLRPFAVVPLTLPRTKISSHQAHNEEAGIDGESNIGTSETVLSSNIPWHDRAFVLAHENAHILGFGRESDANAIAALTCISSKNPVIAYAGWLRILRDTIIYFNPLDEGPRLSNLVRSDLRISEDVTRIEVDPAKNADWKRSYDRQLRSANVPGGIASYEGYLPEIIAHPDLRRMLEAL